MARCLRYNTAMINDKRRLWSLLLFIGMFAPFAVVVAIRLLFPTPRVSADTSPALPTVGALLAKPRSAGPMGSHAKGAPLLAVGDAHDLWVAHPFILDASEPLKGFEVLHRAGNSGEWAVATHEGDAFWLSYPYAVALLPAAASQFSEGVPFVFNEGGNVEMFSIDDKTISESLPGDACGKGGDGVGCGAVCNHARGAGGDGDAAGGSADAGCFVFAVDDAAGVFARWRGGDGHGGGNHDAGDSACDGAELF